MSKKFRKFQKARKRERAEWKFIEDLHKASIKLPPEDAYIANTFIAWHRNHGYLTPKQKTYAVSLIEKSGISAEKRTRIGMAHYLYAISDGVNVKLGFSINPQSRLRDLQTGHPTELKLLWKLEVGNSPAKARRAERQLHRVCGRFQKQGEWFSLECMGEVNEFTVSPELKRERQEQAIERELVMAARQVL